MRSGPAEAQEGERTHTVERRGLMGKVMLELSPNGRRCFSRQRRGRKGIRREAQGVPEQRGVNESACLGA